MVTLAQLVDEVSDQGQHSLGDVLLRAKVFASRLKSRVFKKWVDNEMGGYGASDTLPDYRVVKSSIFGIYCGPFGATIRNKHIPTDNLPAELRKPLSTFELREGVANLSALLGSGDGRVGRHLAWCEIEALRQYGLQFEMMQLNEATAVIDRSSIQGVLSAIRSRLLELLLSLENRYPTLGNSESSTSSIPSDEVDSEALAKLHHLTINAQTVGDVYTGGQVGAMGPGASATNIQFTQALRDAIGAAPLAKLSAELESLRERMLAESTTSAQDESVSAVSAAAEAARKGDSKGVLGYLRKAGDIARAVAEKVGLALATSAIEKAVEPEVVELFGRLMGGGGST